LSTHICTFKRNACQVTKHGIENIVLHSNKLFFPAFFLSGSLSNLLFVQLSVKWQQNKSSHENVCENIYQFRFLWIVVAAVFFDKRSKRVSTSVQLLTHNKKSMFLTHFC
jgi:hypothetical protein